MIGTKHALLGISGPVADISTIQAKLEIVAGQEERSSSAQGLLILEEVLKDVKLPIDFDPIAYYNSRRAKRHSHKIVTV